MADFELLLGGNTIAGSSGVITSHGKELISLEVGGTGELLVNVDVYDPKGQHVAKLHHNSWAFNDASYKVRTQKSDLVLTDGAGNVVLEVNAGTPGHATIRRAELYTPKGTLIQATPEDLRIGGMTFRGSEMRGFGTAFDLND